MSQRLSDALKSIDIDKYGNKLCVVAGVGAGKNHWVINELTQKGNVLLITSRRAVTDETLADNDNAFEAYVKTALDAKQVVVFTNALLAKLIRNSRSPQRLFTFKCRFDYVVIDLKHKSKMDSLPFNLFAILISN